MKEIITYICEICGAAYSSKEIAQKCEALGKPEEYDKNIGKWFIAPIQVIYNQESENASTSTSEVKWRLLRIDANEIINNKNLDFTSILKYDFLTHKLKYSYRTFEDGCILIKEIFKQKIEIKPELYDELNQHLLAMEQKREIMKDNFSHYQIGFAVGIVENICGKMDITLPEIVGVEKYIFSNDIKNG